MALTTDHYTHVIQALFTQELTEFPKASENTRIQQDGATAYMARNPINVINQLFENHILNKNGDISCVWSSSDLPASEYFFVRQITNLCALPKKYYRTEIQNLRRNHQSVNAYPAPHYWKRVLMVREV